MKRIQKYMDIRFEKHKKDWDTVVAICGEVGSGKSNLGLNMLEYWQKKLYGECKPEDVKHMCLTKEMWAEDLSDANKNELTIFDEAGELSSRSALSKFNKNLMVAYQIIRADRIFTILILPDIWYLDSYFRNTRIKGLFYVYKRGSVAFWDKQRLRRLSAINETRIVKNYWNVKPLFYDTFPIYKGEMASLYSKIKQQKTKETREKIKEVFNDKTSNQRANPMRDAYNLLAEKQGHDVAVEMLGISQRTGYNYKKQRKMQIEG